MARLTCNDDARDAWRAFADAFGVSVASLLESMCQFLDPVPEWDQLNERQKQAIRTARELDIEKRRRG